MPGLQEAFYIIAIIFMGVMFILIAALVGAVFVIRSKINKIHDTIEARVNAITSFAEKGGELAAAATSGIVRKARRAIKH